MSEEKLNKNNPETTDINANNKEEGYANPNESSCSAEFSEGCKDEDN